MKKLGRVVEYRLVNVTGWLWDVSAGWDVEADFLVDPKRWFYIAQCLNVTCYRGSWNFVLIVRNIRKFMVSPVFMKMAGGVLAQ